ncbi:unnamed protein product [Pleuronectes platessa]|uniref:DNA damage-inducible transcript 4 protein n=1 Tax=Pleuronectes platessa TaxID=8262 RepID=A0A9N7TR25_PLEPL|nr:unnamed protein product [Pleuronectes platessa]
MQARHWVRWRASLFDWLAREAGGGARQAVYNHCCRTDLGAWTADEEQRSHRRQQIVVLRDNNRGNKQPEEHNGLTQRRLNTSSIRPEKRTDMPALCAASEASGSPHSPVDRRLSWGKLVQRLADFSASGSSSSSSSLELGYNNGSRSDLSDSGSDISSDLSPSDEDLFYDPMEETILKDVVELIEASLREAKDSDCALRCTKLLIPEKLLEHIGQELLHLAASEPCGLRGALIDLCVEHGAVCESMGQLSVDPYLVPTFQLTLVLRLESDGLWPKIQGLFSTKSPFHSSSETRD